MQRNLLMMSKKRDSVSFVDIGTKQNEMKTLEKQLKGLDNVEDISYSNKDQQLKNPRTNGDAWNLFEGDSNPLYDVYYVRAKHQKTRKILRNKQLNSQVF